MSEEQAEFPPSTADLKIILLGDSAVGKSKLIERYLLDDFKPIQLSTYALTIFKHEVEMEGKKVSIDFWDTAGQERFNSLHSSYYYRAHGCIMVFDVTRKETYANLAKWYAELQTHRKGIPILVVANKIDANMKATGKVFQFTVKRGLPSVRFCSASDGTNVVSVFEDMIQQAYHKKMNSITSVSSNNVPIVGEDDDNFVDDVMAVLDYFDAKDTLSTTSSN